jgi:hypothetical protein
METSGWCEDVGARRLWRAVAGRKSRPSVLRSDVSGSCAHHRRPAGHIRRAVSCAENVNASVAVPTKFPELIVVKAAIQWK